MTKVAITAIIALAALEGFALYMHVNGQLFSTVAIIIGGLGGFEIARRRYKK